MKIPNLSITVMLMVLALLLSVSGGVSFAADGAPLTPELAAKKEMVRKQQAQRVTNKQRKAAAATLKAERMKVHKAKQGVRHAPPVANDNK